MKKFFDKANKFIKKNKLNALRDVIIFALVTLTIHYSYRYWARTDYWPVPATMHSAHDRASEIVFRQSTWFIHTILPIPITTSEDRVIHFENGGYIGINESCSGLKPILQFILLFLVFPGPWRKKLWFIPMGVVILHITNLFRIVGLSVVTVTIPEYWQFSHDYLFRPFFYVVIFLLWMWWVERLATPPTPSPEGEGETEQPLT
jgi:exosortase/archaeosortase family protein